ncbi:MAG: hypothetical protein Ct9H300mP15_17050 [Gemmatimonadota bacterium]|nr:MAG: hypothetical protein Ct9H300mP15_17050 [Gemmatimonadota bacterium]
MGLEQAPLRAAYSLQVRLAMRLGCGAYEGLLLLRDSLGAEVSHQQTRTPAEFDEAFLSYASQGTI